MAADPQRSAAIPLMSPPAAHLIARFLTSHRMMFMVRPQLLTTSCVAAALAVAVACSSTPSSPTSPSAAASSGQAGAIGDQSLKANAPVAVAPEHDFTFDSGATVTLEFQAGRAAYVSNAPLDHQIQIRNIADGQVVYEVNVAGSGTVSHQLPNVPTGSYEWQVRAFQGDGAGPWSAARTFTMRGAARGAVTSGPRRPDPPPGARLPAPDMFHVVIGVANQYPGALYNSCQEHGGTWDFMDTLVDTLRRIDDTRWGYAWKRGVVGDPLQDLVAYNWSGDPDEGTRNIYTIDVIGGHCGSFPSPVWNNTQPGGGPGLSAWTGRGRF
jgi:hypothetical protein